MAIQWITFGVMMLVQIVGAVVFIGKLDTRLTALMAAMAKDLDNQGKEIISLREWRHKFGPKEMVYDELGDRMDRIEEHVDRLRDRGRHS